MRKFLSLLLMLVMGVSTMWAKVVVTSPSTEMTDGKYITLQCNDTNGGDGYYFNGATTKSTSLQLSNFYKLVSNGASAFYLQCATTGKYVGNSSNAVSMVDDQANATAFTFSIETVSNWSSIGTTATNGTNTVRFATNGSTPYLNTQPKASNPNFANGTGGYSVWYVTAYDEAEYNVINSYASLYEKATTAYNKVSGVGENLITEASQFDNTCGDSSEGTDPGTLIDNSTSTFWHTDWHNEVSENPHWIGVTISEIDADIQLSLTRRSAASDHVTEFTVYGKKNAEDDWTQLAVLSLPYSSNTETKTAVFNNQGNSILKFAATATSSSRKYWHASEFQLNRVVYRHESVESSIVSALKTEIDKNLSLAEVTTEAYNALKSAYDAYDAQVYDPALPTGKFISVTKANTITASTSAEDNAHWYIITQARGGESMMYNNGSETMKRGTTSETATSLIAKDPTANTKYLVRFVGTSNTGVYHMQFANGEFITADLKTGTSAGDFFFYNINSTDGHFGWNKTTDGTTKADIVDNNGAGNTLAYWSSGEISSTGGNNDWSVYAVEFVDEVSVSYTLTDALSQNYSGTYSTVWNGDNTPAPTFASAAGATITGATYTENAGAYSMTGTITFPFPISNSTTQNATAIKSNDTEYWIAADGNAMATSTAISYLTQSNYSWYIYPSFSEGVFSYKLYNVGAGKWMPATLNSIGGNASALVDEAEAGSYSFSHINTGNGFSTTATSNVFITVNSYSASEKLYHWTYTSGNGHKGSNLTFPTCVVSEESVNTQFAALKGATKFDILEGSTVQGPSEFAAPEEINAAIEAAQSVDDNATAKAEFIASENGQKIQTYLSEVAKYGALANVQFTMNNEYGTLCLPCPSTAITGLKMYTCSAVDGTTLTLDLVSGNFAYDTPYIIQATKGNKYTIIGWDKGSKATHEVGYLTGVLTEGGVAVPAESYVLVTRAADGYQSFVHVSGVNCPQYKCYLTVPAASGSVQAYVFADGVEEATGIEDILGTSAQDGKFIENGQLVIVKGGVKYNVAGQVVK